MLEERDNEGRTLLMYAASVGSAPVFHVVLDAIRLAYGNGGKRVSGRIVLKLGQACLFFSPGPCGRAHVLVGCIARNAIRTRHPVTCVV